MSRRSPIPTGTVTLLFTDVEGSTRLWESEPEQMAEALRRHDEILRAAIEEHGGYVFKTVGDAFCAAFSTPNAALEAAVAAQQSLSSEAWPTRRPVRVRMALHSGVCEEREEDYFGPVVNRVARLEAVAHGEQVLVSGATAELLDGLAVGEIRLKDLGRHRLKDLGRAEQVFQVEAPFLRDAFPPLRSLDNPELANNLPSLLTPFIGREAELAEVGRLLGQSRLVTLTGAGGSGKTRLALQAAADLVDGPGDGVWLVELASVADPDQIAGAVASVLGLTEARAASPVDSLLDALSDQRVLLILDNCEHLVDPAAQLVGRLGETCPDVRILVTSREPLGVQGEQVYRVPSLSLPPVDLDPDDELENYDAVRLFVDRARSQDASFTLEPSVAGLVVDICRRLDGIPLALELAAARLSSMSVMHLHDRLDQRFRLLTGGSRNALPRQQTLQAMVDWSFGLLSAPEQALLRRLAVFSGGFELEAAEAVGAVGGIDAFEVSDLVGSLVDKSLVVVERSSERLRYRLLETIADYAAQEMLRSEGDAAVLEARDRHAAFYLELAEASEPLLSTASQGAVMAKLEVEWDNLRSAIAHLAATPGGGEGVLRFGVALSRFFWSMGHREVFAPLLEAIESSEQPDRILLGRAVVSLAVAESILRGPDPGYDGKIRRLTALAHELGSGSADPYLEAWSVALTAGIAYMENDDARSRALGLEALEIARSSGDEALVGQMLANLATHERVTGDLEASRALHAEALQYFRRLGDTIFIALELHDLAGVALREDIPDEARKHLQEAVGLAEEVGAELLAFGFRSDLCSVLIDAGEMDEAEALMRRSLVAARRLGLRPQQCGLIFAAACIATHQGDLMRAARLHGAADTAIAAAIAERTFGWTDLEDRVRERARAELSAGLDEEVREREYLIGTALSAAEAADLALGRTTVY